MISRMRLNGFVAPFDVDETVKKLMKAERINLERTEQKQITNRYKRDDYLAVNNLLSALQKKASEMKLQANVNKMTTNVTSNNTAITTTAGPYASNATYTVDVIKLATKAKVEGNSFASGAFDPNATLKSQSFSGGTISSDNTAASDYKFSINGVEIAVDSDNDSLNTVINKINNSSAGVTALYDDMNKKIVLTSKKEGLVNGADRSSKDISLTDTTGNFLTNILNLTNGNKISADTAEVSVDGIRMTSSTNKFEVNGVTITAKQVTTTDPSDPSKRVAAASVLEVTRDVDGIVNSIKDFVKSYNDLLSKINTEYNEVHKREYSPLTKEQRKELSENDVELWDTEAKKGMLYHDPIIGRIRSELRSSVIGAFDFEGSSFKSLGAIGLGTTAFTGKSFQNTEGLIQIDEAKLKKALEDDPDTVIKMITNSSTAEGERGLAYRISDKVNRAISDIKERAGAVSTEEDESVLGKELKRLNKDMNRLEELLSKKEDNYYKQFSAMESMMQKYQSQMVAFG